MKAIVVSDQAAGTAGMKLVERPVPQPLRQRGTEMPTPPPKAAAHRHPKSAHRLGSHTQSLDRCLPK